MVHGVITSTVSFRGHSGLRIESVAKLDDGTKFVLKQSGDASNPVRPSTFTSPFGFPQPRSRSEPEPLVMGGHVMVCTEPLYLERDTRVPHMVARMWHRAKPEEAPAAPAPAAATAVATAFQEREPLPEPAVQAAVTEMRTTPFSKNSAVARAIGRELAAAMATDAKAFVLYDPLAPLGYPSFLCLARTNEDPDYNDLDWAIDTIEQLSGSSVGFVRSIGPRISGFIDDMRQSSFQSCMDKAARIPGSIAFISVPGLSRKGSGGAEIENEVLHFCTWEALPPSI